MRLQTERETQEKKQKKDKDNIITLPGGTDLNYSASTTTVQAKQLR